MTPTLFSVSYAGFWGQHRLGVIPFLEKAAALGYPAVEVGGKRPHLAPLDYPEEESLLPIRNAARRLAIEIATIAGYTDFTSDRQSAEVPFVEMQVRYVAYEMCSPLRGGGSEANLDAAARVSLERIKALIGR